MSLATSRGPGVSGRWILEPAPEVGRGCAFRAEIPPPTPTPFLFQYQPLGDVRRASAYPASWIHFRGSFLVSLGVRTSAPSSAL